MLELEERKVNPVQKMVIYFFLYGFIGWVLEVIYAFIIEGKFVNRGFLFGPICPIYGYGAILLVVSLHKINGNRTFKFITAVILFSAFEFLVSYVLEIIFNQRWWDYSNDILNIQGRVSIVYSILWGIMGIIFTEKLHPFIEDKLYKVFRYFKKGTISSVICVLLVALGIDTILSVLHYFGI